jgi:hypothetical protein
VRRVAIEKDRPHRRTAIMYLIAAIVFLLTALLANSAEPVFLVLAMAFVVLALNEGVAARRRV